MKFIGNILWMLLGGFELAVIWLIAGLFMCLTIIGIPFGIQCFKIAGLALWPMGKTIYYGGGTGKFLLNIIWVLIFGWSIALCSALVGILWCFTIIGIPFGLQSLKMAKLAFMPFGSVAK